jgi:hypothetical protein
MNLARDEKERTDWLLLALKRLPRRRNESFLTVRYELRMQQTEYATQDSLGLILWLNGSCDMTTYAFSKVNALAKNVSRENYQGGAPFPIIECRCCESPFYQAKKHLKEE